MLRASVGVLVVSSHALEHPIERTRVVRASQKDIRLRCHHTALVHKLQFQRLRNPVQQHEHQFSSGSVVVSYVPQLLPHELRRLRN
jgi:hypothetical protein